MIVIFIITIILIINGGYIRNTNVSDIYTDDVTRMNKTKVDKIFKIKSKDDIINVLQLARTNNKKVIAAGEKHTMGGQTIVESGYVLNMKKLNKILDFNKEENIIKVEAGATWSKLIKFLDKFNKSPSTLQSYSTFTIGGTISVNAHGITNDDSVNKSVISLDIIDSFGNMKTINKHNELFGLIIGGFGLFGIIYSVTLNVVDNQLIKLRTVELNINNFDDYYKKLLDDKHNNINIKLARINITDLNKINLYLFENVSSEPITSYLEDKPNEMSLIDKLLYKWILPNGKVQKIRYKLESYMKKPIDCSGDITTRNKLLYESAKPLSTLYNPLIYISDTHILQEFFIPANDKNNFVDWMNYLTFIFNNKNIKSNYKRIKLLNITIRFVNTDKLSFLKYAPTNMYAFVFYYRAQLNKEADSELNKIHNLLTNKVLELGGTFYLPYRHHYNKEQLVKAYPNINLFFENKLKYDPNNMFNNLWFNKYKS